MGGLSSVAIAMVVNYIAIGLIIVPQLQHLSIVGIVIIIIGVMIFIVGHIGNAALGLIRAAFSPLGHSMLNSSPSSTKVEAKNTTRLE